MVVMVALGCGHGGSRLWSWWSWWQQVVVMRLRTDHNRLNAQMLREMKLAPSPTCTCGLEDQTAEHILQTMPASADSETTRVIANSSPCSYAHTRLYCSKKKLERRATFILQTGLSL